MHDRIGPCQRTTGICREFCTLAPLDKTVERDHVYNPLCLSAVYMQQTHCFDSISKCFICLLRMCIATQEQLESHLHACVVLLILARVILSCLVNIHHICVVFVCVLVLFQRKVIQRQSTSPGSNVLLMSEHLLDAVMMDSFDDSVDVPNGDIWNCKTGAWTQPFDTISSNLVDDDLHAQLKNQVGGASTVPKTEAQSSSNESTSDVHTADRQPCASGATSSEQPCLVNEVRPNRKGIIAAEPIKSGTFLVQFTGHISSRKAFDESTSKQAWICGVLPYVLFYRGHGDLDLVVDARSKGNLARFLRRSCTPNAEVRPFVSNDCFCLGVYTTRDIAKHDEITIGFDFPFEKW
eukprot:scpid83602/ scgid2336/ Histone-lysine N-methyltransferase MLL5; Myeloid/lymphoid or mixed-lineage leukemia protein 5 homolog